MTSVCSKAGYIVDEWEVASDHVTLEEELGEGAFGKVFRGVLTELPSPSKKLTLASSKGRTVSGQKKAKYTVAIKMLHGGAQQRARHIRERTQQTVLIHGRQPEVTIFRSST